MSTEVQENASVPKYLQLAEQLRGQVRAGLLKPGDQLPSFVELRSRYNVSRGTVEKVHTLLEQDGLIVREQGRGVFVASLPRRAVTGVIGFTGGGFSETETSLYWAHLVAGIREEAARHKMQLLLFDEPTPTLWEKVDGVLISHNQNELHEMLQAIPTALPAISLLMPTTEAACVCANDYQGAYDITQHLLEQGHRNIGFVVAGRDPLIEQRLKGYRDALRDAGISPLLDWVHYVTLRAGSRDSKAEFVEQGCQAVRQWLQKDWRTLGCTALVCQNDHIAVGTIQALMESGLCVPEDVSVVGFDGTEMYDRMSPRLTTVEVPLRQIGVRAVRMLLTRIQESQRPPEAVVLPTQVRIGASTTPPKSG